MKATVFALAMVLSSSAFAGDFFECEGFAGVEEYRAGIDLSIGKAGFFDNDSTQVMKLIKTDYLESHPPQWQYTFEGDNQSQGHQRLIFNNTRLEATMYSVDGDSHSEIGSTSCKEVSEPWDLSDDQ